MENSKKALMAALALIISSGIQANASSDNLFSIRDLNTGIDLIAEGGEGKCGEGSCGEAKDSVKAEPVQAEPAQAIDPLKDLKRVNAKGEPDLKGEFVKGPDGKLIKLNIESPTEKPKTDNDDALPIDTTDEDE